MIDRAQISRMKQASCSKVADNHGEAAFRDYVLAGQLCRHLRLQLRIGAGADHRNVGTVHHDHRDQQGKELEQEFRGQGRFS
jgi:hypothetical protein